MVVVGTAAATGVGAAAGGSGSGFLFASLSVALALFFQSTRDLEFNSLRDLGRFKYVSYSST